MQAAHRGKRDRQRVAELKGKRIEVRSQTQARSALSLDAVCDIV